MGIALCLGTQDIRKPRFGGQRSLHGSLCALARAGEQLWYCTPQAREFALEAAPGLHLRSVASAPGEGPAALWRSLRFGLPYKFGKYFSHRFTAAALSLAREVRADWIFLHGAHLGHAALELKRALGLPLLLREHNIEYELVRQYAAHCPPYLRPAVRWQESRTRRSEQQLWRECDRTLLISDSDFEQARTEGSGNFMRVYDGVTIADAAGYSAEKSGDFLLGGGMDAMQNRTSVRWFLHRVWRPFARRTAAAGVRLAVSGVSTAELLQGGGLRRRDLEAWRIDPLGITPDFSATVRRHRYFISPALLGSGYRVKVAEAGACGACVFLGPVDLRSLAFLRAGENCVQFSRLEDFYTAYEELRAAPERARQLGTALQRDLGRELRWEQHAAQVLGALRELR